MEENLIGRNLQILRLASFLTLQELSERTSINAKTIQKYETGVTEPKVSQLRIFATVFNVPLELIILKKLKLTYEVMEEYIIPLPQLEGKKV
jgi:transcriptional regulator with XRE-family HTH domain